MSARCPEGHLSESLDYCDVCGSPMGAAPADAGATGDAPASVYGGAVPGPDLREPSPAPEAATQTCPHCGALNVADALFCEACGYDFTTGTPPMGSDPAPATTSDEDAAAADEVAPAGDDADEDGDVAEGISTIVDIPSGQTPGMENATDAATETDSGTHEGTETDTGPRTNAASAPDAEPQGGDASSAPLASTDPVSGPTKLGHSAVPSEEEVVEPVREPEPEPEPEPGPPAQPAAPVQRKARHTPPSRALAEAWVVELWVDPDWYAVQQTEEACPSAGVPDIVTLTRSAALIGRPSGSLGLRPEIDAGADSAVSRRHAQLTSDGQRWWVEDLGSSNGTFVGTVGEPLPTAPIPPGQRVEIDRDDRLYIGAWTRIVLRQATESERQGTG